MGALSPCGGKGGFLSPRVEQKGGFAPVWRKRGALPPCGGKGGHPHRAAEGGGFPSGPAVDFQRLENNFICCL